MASVSRRPATGLGLWLILAFSLAIALPSIRYLVPHGPGLAPNVVANRFYHLGLVGMHAGFASVALVLGPFQFMPGIRRRWPSVHRWMGRTYVTCCLVGGAAGLVLAFGASTGAVSTAGFGTLAVLWMFATGQAWRLAMGRRFAEHERWMIRSFALTLAAVTLRLYLPISFALPVRFEDAYRVISFLAWVPNLIAAELFLAARRPLAAGR